MSFVRRTLGLCICVPVLIAACGGSDSSPSGSNGGQGTPIADLPELLATTLCDVVAPCFGPIFPVFLKGQDCKTKQLATLSQGDFSLLEAAVSDGRVKYDGTKVDACISAIKASNCSFLSERMRDVCPGVITGTVDAGGACTMNAECTDGNFCDQSSGACPGKCAALLGAGTVCTNNDECQNGLVCPDDSKVCTKPGKKDDPCGGPNDAGSCGTDSLCAGESATAPGKCASITSAFAAEEGATCDPAPSVLCKEGLVCSAISVDAQNVLTWKCEKPASGSSCHVAYPEQCPQNQYCALTPNTLDGTCKPLPGDGEPCGAHAATDKTKDLCSNTTTCVSGTCKTIQNDGAACTTDAECVSEVCANKKCSPTRCGG